MKTIKELLGLDQRNEEVELDEAKVGDKVSFQHALNSAPGNKVKKSGTVTKIENDVVHVKVKDKYGVQHHKKNMSDLTKEEIELDELDKSTVSSYATKAKKDVEELKPFIKKGQSNIAQRITDRRKKGLAMAAKKMSEESGLEEASKVETAAEVTKHFEKGQSTPSGVPKWVAEPLKKKKKVVEAGDPELMGGAVSKPTASGNNPKLADKFMKAFRKMKSPANISCKTSGMISTCEDASLEEEKLKKSENTSSKDVKKGEKLSGKQEPIKLNPDLKEK